VKICAGKAQVEVTPIIYTCTLKSYDILKVKNIIVESAYRVMEKLLKIALLNL
jgi:hypothetical protein